MPVIEMPNGDQVSFPDDMPGEQIKSLIASWQQGVLDERADAAKSLRNHPGQ